MRNTSIWLSYSVLVVAALMGKGSSHAQAQDYSEDTAAVLITEATLAKYGKGTVLGYYPQAVISRHPVLRTKGHFVFDSGEQRFEKTLIPLVIVFERGTRVLDEKKEWKEVTPETFTYSLATDVLLAKLRTLLAENSKELAPSYLPTEPFTGLKSIAKETPVSRYLLKKGSDMSYFMEIGDRTLLEERHKSLSLPDVVSQIALYQQHFKTMNLQFKIFKLRPGQRPSNPRLVQGVALSRHRHPAMPEGRVVVNYGPDIAAWTMLTTRLTFAGEVADFEFPAAAFLENVIAPLLVEKGKTPPKLECIVGEVEEETACKKSKEGVVSVQAKLAPGGSTTLIAERAANANESSESYRETYRIEMHSTKQ